MGNPESSELDQNRRDAMIGKVVSRYELGFMRLAADMLNMEQFDGLYRIVDSNRVSGGRVLGEDQVKVMIRGSWVEHNPNLSDFWSRVAKLKDEFDGNVK